jgi:hypothetical protein
MSVTFSVLKWLTSRAAHNFMGMTDANIISNMDNSLVFISLCFLVIVYHKWSFAPHSACKDKQKRGKHQRFRPFFSQKYVLALRHQYE